MNDTQKERETTPRRLLTAGEMGARLGLQPDTIRKWALAGKIPSVKAGRRTVRFDPAAVIRALEDRDKERD